MHLVYVYSVNFRTKWVIPLNASVVAQAFPAQ